MKIVFFSSTRAFRAHALASPQFRPVVQGLRTLVMSADASVMYFAVFDQSQNLPRFLSREEALSCTGESESMLLLCIRCKFLMPCFFAVIPTILAAAKTALD